MLEEPSFNPLVGSFGWPTPNPRMFLNQPWYEPLVVQLVSKPSTKLPYMKLQYPPYVTDRDNISEWGENYIRNHPNYTFEELEQAFGKQFRIVKNDEEVYMELHNIQQQIVERVELYYECLLKLANYL